jgi:hypothetical protein
MPNVIGPDGLAAKRRPGYNGPFAWFTQGDLDLTGWNDHGSQKLKCIKAACFTQGGFDVEEQPSFMG